MKTSIAQIFKASITLCVLFLGTLAYVQLGKTEVPKFTYLSMNTRLEIFSIVSTVYCLHYRGNIEQLKLNAPRLFDNSVKIFEKKMQSQNINSDSIRASKNLYRAEIDFVLISSIALIELEIDDKRICQAVFNQQ